MAEGGIVSAQVGAFNVQTNSGESEEELTARLKPQIDRATSEAASQLGKRGAKARSEAKSEPDGSTEDVQVTRTDGEGGEKVEAKPEKRQIKPIPPKTEAKPAEEAEDEEKVETKPEEKPKDRRGDPRHDPNARIREATREAAEAKRALAEERRQREAIEARIAALEQGKQPEPKQEPRQTSGKPDAANFDSYDDYLDARDAYNREQWTKEIEGRLEQHQKRQAEESTLEQAVGRFREAAAEVAGKISEEVGTLRTTFQLGPDERESGENWIANELVFSPENAPALMLHFTAHPDELQRIAALSTPRAVSREMAKLEARLEAAPTATESSSEREPVSRATPPVRTVTGAPYVAERDTYRAGMSLDEYRKIWERQVKNR